MPLAPLADENRAVQLASLAALNAGANSGYLSSLLDAASDLVRRWCCRDFVNPSQYTEFYSGSRSRNQELVLNQFPVLSVQRVACDPSPVLFVQNTGGFFQRATVSTTCTGVTVATVASGNKATVVLPYTSYPTVGSIASAINAMGSGWLATVQAASNIDPTLYPSADIRSTQGAFDVIANGAYLLAWLEDLQPWLGGWTAWAGGADWGLQYGWQCRADEGKLFGSFPAGTDNVRVDYFAGFTSVPAAVEEATVQMAAHLMNTGATDYTTLSVRLGDFSEATAAKVPGMPPPIATLLSPYRAVDNLISRN